MGSTTGGLGGPNVGLGAAAAGAEEAMTGPEEELGENVGSTGRDSDGTPVGMSDRDADAVRTGADEDVVQNDVAGVGGDDVQDVRAPNPALTGDTVEGEPVGAADRDEDIDRSM